MKAIILAALVSIASVAHAAQPIYIAPPQMTPESINAVDAAGGTTLAGTTSLTGTFAGGTLSNNTVTGLLALGFSTSTAENTFTAAQIAAVPTCTTAQASGTICQYYGVVQVHN